MNKVAFLGVLLVVSSCSFLKTMNLSNSDLPFLLSSLKATGEGRGRLSLNNQQYIFSFEAILKQNKDWLLVAAIPLHGEEVLIMPNLDSTKMIEATESSLGDRMEQGIESFLVKNNSPLKAKNFLYELRLLLRFVLHKEIQKQVNCQKKTGQTYSCLLDEQWYELKVSDKKIYIKRIFDEGFYLEFTAENLTESIFSKNSFYLYSQMQGKTPSPILSLELFWK